MRKQPTELNLTGDVPIYEALGITKKRNSELYFMVEEMLIHYTKPAECLAKLAERTDLDEYESAYCSFQLFKIILLKQYHPTLRTMLSHVLKSMM